MKETIYTIPINEVYESDCECPLCELEKKLESEAVDYALGPAMMEPDFRIDSNKNGYCNRHFSLMFKSTNKLPLALVLDTHTESIRHNLEAINKSAKGLKNKKTFLTKKGNIDNITERLLSLLCNAEENCVICDKINHTMKRYVEVLLDMWENDDDFRVKFDNSKGICLKHFKKLLLSLKKNMREKNAKLFLSNLLEKECSEFSRIQDDIHKFTLKFDYRNKDMEWGNAKDAPFRTIEKISGYINDNNS